MAMAEKQGAIFLDRDGVINQNLLDHVKCWDEFEFIPGALQSLRDLSQTGLPIFVVTNQAVISRQLITPEQLDDIHARMIDCIEAGGGRITHVYYCPHDSNEECNCRKPAPGMLLKAAEEYNIDLSQSFMVGDAWTDVAAGLAVNARSILLLTGRGRWNLIHCVNRFGLDFSAAADLADATMLIRETLNGNPMYTTARLRNAFHMGLRVESLVL
jgi:D-glycero-D-manno-heptose 1,7-bisphosphate phosphatase